MRTVTEAIGVARFNLLGRLPERPERAKGLGYHLPRDFALPRRIHSPRHDPHNAAAPCSKSFVGNPNFSDGLPEISSMATVRSKSVDDHLDLILVTTVKVLDC
jgi:hypothetical protein